MGESSFYRSIIIFEISEYTNLLKFESKILIGELVKNLVKTGNNNETGRGEKNQIVDSESSF